MVLHLHNKRLPNKMAKTQKATGTSAKKPAAAPTQSTPVASAVASATVPLFKCTAATWPLKAQSGNTIRAYAYKVAMQLTAAHRKGFTLVQYRKALVAGQVASNKAITGFKLPSGGWLAHNMPTWASNPKQAWLVTA